MYAPRTHTGNATAVLGAELSGTGLKSGSVALKRSTRVVASWSPARLFVQRRIPRAHMLSHAHAHCITSDEQSYLPSPSIYTTELQHDVPASGIAAARQAK